jgi:hypothetical protein
MARVLALTTIVLATFAAIASAAVSSGNLRTAERYVSRHCHRGSVRSKNMWESDPTFRFNALYGDCGGGDGRDQRIWFFAGKHFVGTDARGSSGSIVGLWRDLNTIAFVYVLYRPQDALCCATGGGAIVRYRWTGKRVVRLDPLPPRTASAHQPGRYP